ncbi:MAG: MutS-related protein, partial [Streptosporangiaceae bacterium]
MPFRSILFNRTEDIADTAERAAPPFFHDLNLDQIVESATSGREDYDLETFFYIPLTDLDAIDYRHEVFRDLESPDLPGYVRAFADRMRTMRAHLAQVDKLHYTYQKEHWYLDAVEVYCDAVSRFADDLRSAEMTSRGFLAFREYMASYVGSDRLRSLLAETKSLKDDLNAVRYCMRIKGNRITVRRYDDEADYSEEVSETFEKFKQGAVKDHRARFRSGPDMDHVEAGVLDLVARLHPDVFATLDSFCDRHRDYLDDAIARFDREVQFYLAYLEYVEPLWAAGLRFSYPSVCDRSKDVAAYETFDLALASKLTSEGAFVVCNDFSLKDPERVLVVSGPNQGGKTTLARTFGQLHYLASIGCPVPGTEAQLFLYDQIFTHFEREEDLSNLRGKLEDELVRMHEILAETTPQSVIIMNEIFTATTLSDALHLGTEVLTQVIELDALCVCVTFIDELSSLSETTVSMVSTVVPDNPAVRTYKVVRKPADGLAYATAIAEKYGLTYGRLKERV